MKKRIRDIIRVAVTVAATAFVVRIVIRNAMDISQEYTMLCIAALVIIGAAIVTAD